MTIDVRKPELTDAEITDVVDGLMGVMVSACCREVGGTGVWIAGSLGDTVSEATKLRVLAAFEQRVTEMRNKAETLKI